MTDRFDFIEIGKKRRQRLASGRLGSAISPISPARGIALLEVIGEPGTGPGQLNSPMALALDREGNLYIADSGNHRVQRITPGGEVTSYGQKGIDPGKLLNPVAVVVERSGCWWVAEQGSHRLQKFDYLGRLVGCLGGFGSSAGLFRYPCGLALDPADNLLVADTGNDRVQLFSLDGSYLRSYGKRPGGQRLRKPQGVAPDGLGAVYVADTCRHRIVKYGRSGETLLTLGLPGDGWGQLDQPCQLVLDNQDSLAVVERGNNRIQAFSLDGRPLWIWPRDKSVSLNRPCGLVGDLQGGYYLADTLHHRVLRIGPR